MLKKCKLCSILSICLLALSASINVEAAMMPTPPPDVSDYYIFQTFDSTLSTDWSGGPTGLSLSGSWNKSSLVAWDSTGGGSVKLNNYFQATIFAYELRLQNTQQRPVAE